MRCGSRRRFALRSGNHAREVTVFTAAIFDMDGLLLDSERVIMQAWLESAAAEGLPLSQPDFLFVVGCGAEESSARLTALLGSGGNFQLVRDRARARLTAGSGILFPLKAGALELLKTLRQRGVPCAVASSTYVEEVRRRLALVGVLDFFQAVAGGDEVTHSKPDPAVYLLAASRLGVPPARCLAFEDSDHGARAADAAGLRVVMVPDLRAYDFTSAYMQLASLEDAMVHVDRWFSDSALCTP
jgi:beta-phosphoglucomutase-like phosphatase (HAD superfamily)